MEERPRVLIRTYRGHSQADAAVKFRGDAEKLASVGYRPTSQSWAQGSYGCGSFLVALLLAVVLVGILIFIYMLFVKPEGTLTVTYQLQDAATPIGGSASTSSVADDLARLADLRAKGILSDEEFAAKKKQLLGL